MPAGVGCMLPSTPGNLRRCRHRPRHQNQPPRM